MPAVDVLLFGAHPDDVEWGVGGIVLRLRENGASFALVDFTRGELGSRGTLAARQVEALRAAEFMGAQVRENLRLPDGGLADTPAGRFLVARAIRRYRPEIVLAPYWEDRHPDHAAAGLMVRNSALYCALKKSEDAQPPFLPKMFLYYPLHKSVTPTIVVDTSELFAKKLELLRLHESQFEKTAEQFGVLPQGLGDYFYALETRDRYYGGQIGVRLGEALVADRPLELGSLARLLKLLGRGT